MRVFCVFVNEWSSMDHEEALPSPVLINHPKTKNNLCQTKFVYIPYQNKTK